MTCKYKVGYISQSTPHIALSPPSGTLWSYLDGKVKKNKNGMADFVQ